MSHVYTESGGICSHCFNLEGLRLRICQLPNGQYPSEAIAASQAELTDDASQCNNLRPPTGEWSLREYLLQIK